MFLPDNYIRRTSSTIPFGYELDENFDGYLKPITEELQILKEVHRLYLLVMSLMKTLMAI